MYNIHVKPRGNKIDAMPLSGDSESGGCRLGSEPVRPENSEVPGGARDPEVSGGARDPEVPGGAQDPMRDDVDGDEAMVPRVPNLPVSSLRSVEGSSARTHSSREEGELPEIGIDCGFFGRD